jgi:hypothetical protein
MRARMTVALVLLLCGGCIVAPLRIANDLKITVVDDATGKPIPVAPVVYFVCVVHDFSCRHAIFVETRTNASGLVRIKGKRKWGVWIPAPGGLPVPNHTIAVWAPGHSAFVFTQYGSGIEDTKWRVQRADVLAALDRVPADTSSSDPRLNPVASLAGGVIRLRAAKP